MKALELDERARLRKVCHDLIADCRRFGASKMELEACTTILDLDELKTRLLRRLAEAPRSAA